MQKLQQQTLSFNHFTLNLTRGSLLIGTEEVRLRPKSFEVLRYLVENSGRLVTKDELLDKVWPQTAVTDDSLVQCLVEVRKVLGEDGQRIVKTVPRRGYIFEANVASTTIHPTTTGDEARPEVVDARDGKGDLDKTEELVSPGDRVLQPAARIAEATRAESVNPLPDNPSPHVSEGNTSTKKKLYLTFAVLALVPIIYGVYSLVGRTKGNNPTHPVKLTKLTAHGKAVTVAISPDGRYVAYAFDDAGKQSVVLRQVSSSTTREMVAPFDGYFLALTFAPDGNSLYYVKAARGSRHRSLYQVGLLGGDSRQVMDDVDSAVSFSPDGKKFAFLRGYVEVPEMVLLVANSDGGNEERITSRRRPEFTDLTDPAWSPDGKSIAFIVWSNNSQGYSASIDEVNLTDKSERKISTDGWRAMNSIAWKADGKSLVVAARDRGSLAGSPLQLWNIAYPDGKAQRITTDVNNYVSARLSVNSHTHVAVVQVNVANIWVTPGTDASQAKQITSSNQAGLHLAWGRNDKIVFMAVESENRDLWTVNSDGSNPKQLTFGTSADVRPATTPDDRYIVYLSSANGKWGTWRMNADGRNAVDLTEEQTIDEWSYPVCSPDSSSFLYTSALGSTRALLKRPLEDGATVTLAERVNLHDQAISPDGKLVAYFFRKPELDGALHVEIISFADGSIVRTLRVSPAAELLRWSPDGNALNYVETIQGVSNIWSLSLDGKESRQLTNWKTDLILEFQWSRTGKQLAVTRGTSSYDLVLIEELIAE